MKKNEKIITFIITLLLLLLIVIFYFNKKWLFEKDVNINILKSCLMFSQCGVIEGVSHHINGTGGKEGWLAYGPYMQLKEGNYEVKFKLCLENLNTGENPSKMAAYCNVDIEGHPKMCKQIDLTLSTFLNKHPKNITVCFKVPAGSPKIQYRVFQYGGNSISVESLRLMTIVSPKFPFETASVRKVIIGFIVFFILSCVILFIKHDIIFIAFNENEQLLNAKQDNEMPVKRSILKETGAFVLAAVICLLILTWVMKLWLPDWRKPIPFDYGGDALFSGMLIKATIDNNWYWRNDFVGAPAGLLMHDYPMTDNFHFLIIKIISIFSSNWALVMNIFFILTFLLTTISALYVFRQFNISYAPSLIGSLLYAFMPNHFLRNVNHLFIVSYYAVPLIVMVILWVYSENPPFFTMGKDNKNPKFKILDYRSITSIMIPLIIASTGIYYAFFACFFLSVAGFSAYISRRNVYNLIAALIVTVTIIIGVLLNLSPSLTYQFKNGKNAATIHNDLNGAEYHGLKVIQLLLPMTEHRIPELAKIKKSYNARAFLVNENDTVTLGFIGSIGFIILVGWLFYKRSNSSDFHLIDNLSGLNISAILFTTIGGFASIFATFVSPQLRAYNRISVYIFFFSLFVIVLFLDLIYHNYAKSITGKIMYYGFLSIFLVFGIFDQTNKHFALSEPWVKERYESDDAFIKAIEKTVPGNTMIFQLPYMPFPESGVLHWLGDYELFKGYLHSGNLRWSFGAMKGRECDLWQKEVSSKPLILFLNEISLAGFGGIYVDAYGYAECFTPPGPKVLLDLASILKKQPMTNGRYYFFNIAEYRENLKQKYTENEWTEERNAILSNLK